MEAAKKEQIGLRDVTDFQSTTGGGVSAQFDGRRVLVGKEKFLADSGVTFSNELRRQADRLQEQAQTTVWVAVDGQAVGVLGIADPIKPTTRTAIRALHDMGLKIIMCTGDNRRTAESVARELGIDEFREEVMPDEKIEIVKRLKASGAIVAMAATELTTRLRSRPPMWELQWGLGPMSRSKRQHHARQRRSDGHCQSDASQSRGDAKYPAKPVLRVHIQRARRADRCRYPLSILRHSPQPDDRRRRDEL